MVQKDLKKIIVICGPTGVGKSSIAVLMAKRFNGEIVNADSQQVYRGFDIGTAKLGDKEREGIPHHVVDVVEPNESFDAAKYVVLADRAIEDIRSRGKNVFIVGGTGMYIRLLIEGVCKAPPRYPKIREELERQIKEYGLACLHERLRQVDPITARVVHQNDQIRIIRALEIYEITGMPVSQFYAEHRFAGKRYQALKIGINMDRKELYDKLNARVDNMLSRGWEKEVKTLLKNYSVDCQAFAAIGYKEMASLVAGRLPLETAASLIKRHSRQYAKRQLTWFRADKEISWFVPGDVEAISRNVESFLSSN